MIFSTVNKIPVLVLEKLNILFQLLAEKKTEFEAFAAKVKDIHLKRTVLSLAQETNQYAIELCSQIEIIMGGHVKKDPEEIEGPEIQSRRERVGRVQGQEEILKSCELSETSMIIAYRNILNEPFLHDNLRKLIRYQLNGITYAFMQLRLLTTSLRIQIYI